MITYYNNIIKVKLYYFLVRLYQFLNASTVMSKDKKVGTGKDKKIPNNRNFAEDKMKEYIIKRSKEIFEYMTEIRRYIHVHPGTGFDNRETTGYIKKKLDELNIPSHYVGKCGLSAVIGKGDLCFLLRADTDGLEVTEESELSYASKNGRAHLCGHDIHAAQLIGAARLLKERENELGGMVKLMFQSAEETLCGADDMIKNGILNSPSPDAGMMIHVMTGTDLETGSLIIPEYGESAPSADFFEITVSGKGCHGSSPNMGKDPLYTACSIVTALSHISSRELSLKDRAAITIGSINSGAAANVIPNKAKLYGTMRCFGEKLREYLKKRICEIAQNTAYTFDTNAEVRFTSGCPSLVNNAELCNMLQGTFEDVFGKEYVISSLPDSGTYGSEDFAYISQKIPTVMIALSAGEKSDGHIYPLHHPRVTFDENAMINGCAALALGAVGFFEKNGETRM